MNRWKCIKTLKMEVTGEIAFFEGTVYYGSPSATPLGEWAMAFIDDTGDNHLMTSGALHEHFERVEDEEPR